MWKAFLAKPSLPFVLRLLGGMSQGHAPTQLLVGETLIPLLHKLEHVASQGNIGSLAENLMEALAKNSTVAQKVAPQLLAQENTDAACSQVIIFYRRSPKCGSKQDLRRSDWQWLCGRSSSKRSA